MPRLARLRGIYQVRWTPFWKFRWKHWQPRISFFSRSQLWKQNAQLGSFPRSWAQEKPNGQQHWIRFGQTSNVRTWASCRATSHSARRQDHSVCVSMCTLKFSLDSHNRSKDQLTRLHTVVKPFAHLLGSVLNLRILSPQMLWGHLQETSLLHRHQCARYLRLWCTKGSKKLWWHGHWSHWSL